MTILLTSSFGCRFVNRTISKQQSTVTSQLTQKIIKEIKIFKTIFPILLWIEIEIQIKCVWWWFWNLDQLKKNMYVILTQNLDAIFAKRTRILEETKYLNNCITLQNSESSLKTQDLCSRQSWAHLEWMTKWLQSRRIHGGLCFDEG